MSTTAHERAVLARITEHRARLNLTQQQLADAVGVKRSLVGAWLEKRSCPRIGVLVKLAKLFGLTLDKLVALPKPAPKRMYSDAAQPLVSRLP